jgi:WD40 repeat protein
MPADPVQTHVAKTFAHNAPLLGCRIDPAGKFVYAGGQDNKIIRWDLASDAKLELGGHDSWVRGFVFSLNGAVMISFGWDGRMVWWNAQAEPPAPIRTVEAHLGWIRNVVVSPDGQTLASCGNDLKVKLWKMDDGALLKEFSGHQRHVYNVAFHPDGKQLVSGDLIARFIHWDVTNGQMIREFMIPSMTKYDPTFMADYGGPYSLSFNADGKRLLAGGITNVSNAFAGVGNPILVEIDWETGKDAMTHLCNPAPNGKVQGAAFHSEGFIVGAVGGGGGGWAYFWKPDSKDEFHKLNLGSPARDLSMHPDGVQFATPHFDQKVRLCKMAAKG